MAAPGRHVEHVMGTVFSLDLRDPALAEGAVDEVVRWWHWVDEVFSTYRPESRISRLGRGEITLRECPQEVAEILDLCAEAGRRSGGWFSAMPGGSLDPSGMVKGWSVERAAAMLAAAGSGAHAVNGGGDVRCVGSAGPGTPWQIGIAHPLRPGELVAVVSGEDFAVATSGIAERGTHVLDPYTGRPADRLASVSLVGEDLTWVDAYATAALAMGPRCRDWITRLDGIEGLVVDLEGGEWTSPGWASRTGDPAHR
ncbi:MAG: FAD:protein transferase [Frankiales bacterium]|jgi:thiamine biosynthesis lipoprotein|nr:FAD:protein transferase [Frankiales bacterium]